MMKKLASVAHDEIQFQEELRKIKEEIENSTRPKMKLNTLNKKLNDCVKKSM